MPDVSPTLPRGRHLIDLQDTCPTVLGDRWGAWSLNTGVRGPSAPHRRSSSAAGLAADSGPLEGHALLSSLLPRVALANLSRFCAPGWATHFSSLATSEALFSHSPAPAQAKLRHVLMTVYFHEDRSLPLQGQSSRWPSSLENNSSNGAADSRQRAPRAPAGRPSRTLQRIAVPCGTRRLPLSVMASLAVLPTRRDDLAQYWKL